MHTGSASSRPQMVSVLTYGDSMLFLKCVTDRGGSERTEALAVSVTLFESPLEAVS